MQDIIEWSNNISVTTHHYQVQINHCSLFTDRLAITCRAHTAITNSYMGETFIYVLEDSWFSPRLECLAN